MAKFLRLQNSAANSERATTPGNSEGQLDQKETTEVAGITNVVKSIGSKIASALEWFGQGIDNLANKIFGTEIPAKATRAEVKSGAAATKPQDAAHTPNDHKPDHEHAPTEKHAAVEVKPETATGENEGVEGLYANAPFDQAMQIITGQLNIPTGTVLNAGSGMHNVDGGFPKSKITYLDKDPKAVTEQKKAGKTVVDSPVEDYKPKDRPDLTLLMSVDLNSEQLAKALDLVEPGKHLIMRNWDGVPSGMRAHPEFKLAGFMPKDGQKVETSHPEDYLNEGPSAKDGTGGYYVFVREDKKDKAEKGEVTPIDKKKPTKPAAKDAHQPHKKAA